ncbi:MAG: sporulation protein [Lachnospiraceae bacterium]|jgi:stage III sporulation protein AB|nr:sporulation protein [Lachnospiraceae bacterium]NBJ83114.1 sporulation protein [bacterium 1XD42-76]NBK06405.1 sporulation protein [bacterium 1XD42-94]
MRYAGIFMMAGALMAGGFWAAEKWKERVQILLLLRQMVFYLKGQILYSNATLPEALGEVGKRFQNGRSGVFAEPGSLFLRVQKRMEEESGIPFFAIWKEEVERLPDDFPMSAADRQTLSSLGENLGYADRDMQERTLLFYLEQTEGAIAFLKKESESRTKLYRCLGMAAGLFLLVMLV